MLRGSADPRSRYSCRSLSPSGWPKCEVSSSQGECGALYIRACRRTAGLSCFGCFDEVDRRIGEEIRHVTARFDGLAVVVDLVGKLVAFNVSVIMAEELVEAPFLGLVAGVFAEMPFAEQAGAVAGLLEQLSDGDFVGPSVSPPNRVL